MAMDKIDAMRLAALGARLGFQTLFLILESIEDRTVNIEYVERRAKLVETPEAILEEVRKKMEVDNKI